MYISVLIYFNGRSTLLSKVLNILENDNFVNVLFVNLFQLVVLKSLVKNMSVLYQLTLVFSMLSEFE